MKLPIISFIFLFIKLSESRDCETNSYKNVFEITSINEKGFMTCCDYKNCHLYISELFVNSARIITSLTHISQVTEINFHSENVSMLMDSIASSGSNKILKIYRADETSFKDISYKNFLEMHELKILELINGELTTICSDTFNDLTSLEVLNLEKNEIKFLHPNLLKNVVKVKKINLSDNSIEIVHPRIFETLKNLEEIYFRGNELIYLDERQFQNNLKISVLYLNENNLDFINSNTFDNLEFLTDFNIDDNSCIDEIEYEYNNRSYLITSELKKKFIEDCNRKDENIEEINEKIELYLRWFKNKSYIKNCKLEKFSTFEDFKLNSANKMIINFTTFIFILFLHNLL